jgi:hypothetical protein
LVTRKYSKGENVMNRRTTLIILAIGLAVMFGVPAAMAQQQYVYPQKGQSADQQKKDEYDCHGWAVKQTGFDPTKPQSPPPQQAAAPKPATTPTGVKPGAGVGGAARGAVVGEVVADDPSAGAKAGAVAARGSSRRQNAAQQQQAQAQQQAQTQQASTQQSAKQQDYLKARGACLEGKGYSVK